MNKIITFLFFIFVTSLFAQSAIHSVSVVDSDTKLPIENATVIVMKTKQILLTNNEGKVTFELKGASNLQIFHSSYTTRTMRWTTLIQNQNTVFLKIKYNKLDEVILTKESPKIILEELVANSIKKLSVPARLKIYAREFFKLNGQYAYYNDGLINFQFVMNQKKLNTTLLVEQNRSFGLLEKDISLDLLGYNLNNIMENYYTFKYLKPILDSKRSKEYSFLIKAHSSRNDCYVMTVIPADETQGLLDDYEILYDPIKKIIIEYSSVISPKTFTKMEGKNRVDGKTITKSVFKVTYRIDASSYYLLTSNEEIAYDFVQKGEMKSIEVRNHFVTTSFNRQNFTYQDKDVFKDKTLFNKNNSILSNYWNVSGFTANADEIDIIKKIELKL